jgi:uncharacterized membrane protein
MFGTTKKAELKDSVVTSGELVSELASDKKFRRELKKAAQHGQTAWARAEQKQHPHRTRNRLLKWTLVGGAATVAAVPAARKPVMQRLSGIGLGLPKSGRVVTGSIEVGVPVATAYNQWTQFEEFPSFMSGVESVRQLDDTLLHWVASIGGKRAEWDAKIVEQHPDRQVTWVSDSGKTTRGTVSFEPIGSGRTLISVSMSYKASGIRELVGSAFGVDKRRVNGDLQRFKELIESRGAASGAWRGEVSGGKEQREEPVSAFIAPPSPATDLPR